jgi:KipI family sensor histidine kinase inhibitor
MPLDRCGRRSRPTVSHCSRSSDADLRHRGSGRHVKAEVSPYGDGAFLIEVGGAVDAHRLAAAIAEEGSSGRAPGGVGETVVGDGNVVVHLDPVTVQPEPIERWLAAVAMQLENGAPPSAQQSSDDHRHVEIPVTFDGADLDMVATMVGVTSATVIELVTAAKLTVAFIGFAPGFPYLVGLPSELASVPRRSSPRTSVPRGSLAVGGGFASVYPESMPGGWMLLGRTEMQLFDPTRPPYALLRPGDTVTFDEEPITAGSTVIESVSHVGSPLPPLSSPPKNTRGRERLVNRGARFAEVLDAGLMSMIEDGGRRSVAALGIPRAGPADPETMRLANRLVGNADNDAAIEITAAGPRLRFSDDAHVAVVASGDGVDVTLDGHPMAAGVVVPVEGGQVVGVGRVQTALRAYLAVGGGFDTRVVIGSRSSDLLSGLGPGPLEVGDCLDLGTPSRPHGFLRHSADPTLPARQHRVRVVPGPHRFPPTQWEQLIVHPWQVGEASNRVGIRLTAPDHSVARRSDPASSTGMVNGGIQIPPDGNPIILMPDHATVGGYPVIACVISADLSILGRLRPGDSLVLVAVDRPTALQARIQSERALDQRVSGWFPTAAAT